MAKVSLIAVFCSSFYCFILFSSIYKCFVCDICCKFIWVDNMLKDVQMFLWGLAVRLWLWEIKIGTEGKLLGHLELCVNLLFRQRYQKSRKCVANILLASTGVSVTEGSKRTMLLCYFFIFSLINFVNNATKCRCHKQKKWKSWDKKY